ncbi:MAG: hypothetical protein J5949_08845, partial [Oscillospiraceae bacterium]|nr:hypothetical protein [Oscillospiraceae bacterium]
PARFEPELRTVPMEEPDRNPRPEVPPLRPTPQPMQPTEPIVAAPAETPHEAPRSAESEEMTAADGDVAELEKTILKQAREKLPIELRFSVEDPAKFRLMIQNRDLALEAVPGFLLDRLKKPEVRAVFSAVAENVLGHPVSVKLSELSKDRHSVRDLNELKQFKEVTFLS